MDNYAIILLTLFFWGENMNHGVDIIENIELKPNKLKVYSLITLLNSYCRGILIPILSLMLLDKNISLSSLSIVLGTYALTAVILELPTGIAADIMGRKKVFCLSLIISEISFSIILFGHGILILCLAMVFYGLSRSLASGSFDALFIDWYIDTYGKEKLSKITARLSVLDALGLSLGAITGGLFPVWSKHLLPELGAYDLNIIIKILLTLALIFISIIFISETDSFQKTERISIRKHIENSSSIVFKNKTLIYIFISVFSTGYFLSALETYYQPHFKALLSGSNMIWLLGIMAFLYLAAGMLGSIFSERIIDRYKYDNKKLYMLLRLLLSFSLILLSFQIKIPSFIALYTITYLLFGMANIPEGIIINLEIPNEIRASVLSVYSLTLQAGALTGSFVNSIIINFIPIPALWLISAVIILLTVIIMNNNS